MSTETVESLHAFTDSVLVRVNERDGQPWLMNHPERGWASCGVPWTWERLARIEGWSRGESYRDADGDGFWIIRSQSSKTNDRRTAR